MIPFGFISLTFLSLLSFGLGQFNYYEFVNLGLFKSNYSPQKRYMNEVLPEPSGSLPSLRHIPFTDKAGRYYYLNHSDYLVAYSASFELIDAVKLSGQPSIPVPVVNDDLELIVTVYNSTFPVLSCQVFIYNVTSRVSSTRILVSGHTCRSPVALVAKFSDFDNEDSIAFVASTSVYIFSITNPTRVPLLRDISISFPSSFFQGPNPFPDHGTFVALKARQNRTLITYPSGRQFRAVYLSPDLYTYASFSSSSCQPFGLQYVPSEFAFALFCSSTQVGLLRVFLRSASSEYHMYEQTPELACKPGAYLDGNVVTIRCSVYIYRFNLVSGSTIDSLTLPVAQYNFGETLMQSSDNSSNVYIPVYPSATSGSMFMVHNFGNLYTYYMIMPDSLRLENFNLSIVYPEYFGFFQDFKNSSNRAVFISHLNEPSIPSSTPTSTSSATSSPTTTISASSTASMSPSYGSSASVTPTISDSASFSSTISFSSSASPSVTPSSQASLFFPSVGGTDSVSPSASATATPQRDATTIIYNNGGGQNTVIISVVIVGVIVVIVLLFVARRYQLKLQRNQKLTSVGETVLDIGLAPVVVSRDKKMGKVKSNTGPLSVAQQYRATRGVSNW